MSVVYDRIVNTRDSYEATSISVEIAKDIMGATVPYDIVYTHVMFNDHFITELRRQMTGEIIFNYFSIPEQLFYDDYVLFVNGGAYSAGIEFALIALDKWLVAEVMMEPHPAVSLPVQNVSSVNPWMRT